MVLEKRGREENFYKQLQDITLQRLEQLCGKRWTDYNVHDPGITIADNFNYALFELHYRLQFPLEAYLMQPGAKKVVFAQKGLLPKEELFSGSIVTEQDYEQLFLASFQSIKKCTVKLNRQTKLYDVFITTIADTGETGEVKLKESIRSMYHINRNLCENIGEIVLGFDKLDDDKLYKKGRLLTKNLYEFPDFYEAGNSIDDEIEPFSAEYHSMQFDFPENYGIGERGLPVGTTTTDTAKIQQLKAYLLIFDYLMADALQQADALKEFLEFSGVVPGYALPEVVIPEAEQLVDETLKNTTFLRDDVYYEHQKALYLNALDILYGEDTRHIYDLKSEVSQEDINEKRANLIRKLPALNACRFRSFNIFDAASAPTIQVMLESLTGIEVVNEETDTFNKYGLRIISDEEFYDKYRFLQNTAFAIDKEDAALLDVDEIAVVYEDKAFHKLRMNINLLWYNVLFKSFLHYGDTKENYKILPLPDNEYLLIFRHPEKGDWINMGLFFSTIEKLTETANLFWQFIGKIKHKELHSNFYFVEHLLLSHGHGDDSDRLSVVICDKGLSYTKKDHIEVVLNERLPAHLKVTVFYVSSDSMKHFEAIYRNWRDLLASGSIDKADYESIVIRGFLSSHIHHSKQL